jgi:hypothetical protein
MPTRTRNRMRSAPPGVLPLKEVVLRSRVSITSQQTAPARWYARVGASQLELGNVEGLCRPER